MCFLKLQPEAGTCRDPLQNKGWKAPFPPSFFSFSSLFSVRAIFMLSICCAPGLLQGSFYWTLVSQYLHLVSQFGGMLPRGCPSISWLRRPGGHASWIPWGCNKQTVLGRLLLNLPTAPWPCTDTTQKHTTNLSEKRPIC